MRLFDHGRSDGRWYELLEYVEHGSLEELIHQEGPKLSERRIREILVEMATAIDHLHRHEVVHRDIKPSNVLVRTLQPLDLVLADFGIASVLGQESRRFTTGNRTIAYAAPETAAGEISQAADWWSLLAAASSAREWRLLGSREYPQNIGVARGLSFTITRNTRSSRSEQSRSKSVRN